VIPDPEWQRAMDAATILERIVRARGIATGVPHAAHGSDGYPVVVTVSTSEPPAELVATALEVGLVLRVTHGPISDLRRSEWSGDGWTTVAAAAAPRP
jgi:hypothetical protein